MLLTKEIYQNCKFHMHDPLHVELEMNGLKKPHSLSHLDPVAVYLCCHARRLFCYILGCLIIGSVACDKTRNSRSATFWFNGIVSLVWQLRFGFLDGLKLICKGFLNICLVFYVCCSQRLENVHRNNRD